MKKPNLIEICIWIFIFAFLLNFSWEAIHTPLYLMEDYEFTYNNYLKMLLVVSFKDALITILVFLGISLIMKKTGWLLKSDKIPYLISSLVGLIIAIIIEYKSVYMQGIWDYNVLMPVIPVIGIGITPLLQLMILIPLSFWLAKKHLS